MKLPSSSQSSPFSSFSSCSSSSTTTTTTTTTFDATKSKGTGNGCIVGILRRLLGYGSLPTHPFDHIAEETNFVDQPHKDQEFKPKAETEETEPSATPNLVARIMGLESIQKANVASISRSRSMNFANRLSGDDDSTHEHERQGVKSFREMPTFLENEEFLILSFENGSESRARRSSKGRKCQTGNGEMRSKKAGKSRNKENRTEKQLEKDNKQQVEKSSRRRAMKNLNGKETLRSKTYHKPKKETICDVLKDVESDCISEDLSPISVLDCGQFLVDTEVPTSEEDSVLASSFPRRKDDCLTCDARKINIIEGKCLGSKKKECHTAEYFDILDEICKLTEEELVGSKWFVHKNMWRNDEVSAGIAADFESKVLSQLIEELLVDQICRLSY